MAETNVATTELPKVVYEAHTAVVRALEAKFPGAHYLNGLRGQQNCTFVTALDNPEAVQQFASQKLGYKGLDGVIHITESWSKLQAGKLITKQVLEGALNGNPKKILLAKNRLTVSGAAHEFFHWLNHPYWGYMFDGYSDLNEGATELLMREMLGGEYSNKEYDKEAGKVKDTLVNGYTLVDLQQAFFNGDLVALNKTVAAFSTLRVYSTDLMGFYKELSGRLKKLKEILKIT
jgi:hypothetical protein